jgi:glutaredoxin
MTAHSSLATHAPTISVTIFSKNDCANCANTEKQFTRKGVPYTEINVQEDTEPREEFGGLTPFDYVVANYGRQMPIVVVEDSDNEWGDWWTGARIDKMLATIKRFSDTDQLIPENERITA